MSTFLIRHATGGPDPKDTLESYIVVGVSTELNGIQLQRGQMIQTLSAFQGGEYLLCTLEGEVIQELQGVTKEQLLLYCEESDC